MILRIFATQVLAQAAIDAIDAAQGPTEILRGPDGVEYVAARKPWAAPIRLRDGTWGVPWKPRIEAVGVIRQADCVAKANGDRA